MPGINEPIYRVATHSTSKAWRERFGRYRLTGTQCPQCGMEYYPRRPVCVKCHNTNVIDKDFPYTGTIIAHCIDYFPLSGYGQQVPTVIAAIQLDANGPVILSHIVDIDAAKVKVGNRVEMVIRKVRRESNGNYQYSHKFRVTHEI